MTYNILHGGRDARSDARLAQVCTLIRRVAPDILVLNECNDFERNGFRTLHRVEREISMRGLLAPASSGYHVALFVRQAQPVEVHLLDADVHHSAIAATLDLGELRCTVVGAHLCPFSAEVRVSEAQQLTRFLGEGHVFLLGDLNALSPHDAPQLQSARWLPRRRVRHELAGSPGMLDTRAVAVLETCGLVDTFRASGTSAPTVQTPLCPGWQDYQVRLDYAFASLGAAERVRKVERIDGPLADAASDHYALAIDVEL
ncbi:MAG: endonuclease/exonuclease/phosphatase family protein [Deltaproteobacteria bacterium]